MVQGGAREEKVMSMEMPEGAAPHPVADRLCAIVFLAVGAGAFYMSSGYLPSGRTFPMLVSIVLMICSVAIFVRSFRSSPALFYVGPTPSWLAGVTGLMFLILIYVISVAHLGYTTSTLIFIPLAAYLCGLRSPWWLLFGTLGYVLLSSTVFLRLFHTQLPPDLILRLL
jgi:hypothetical protein